MARWVEQLANFEYKIIHRPGKQHANADALSRLPGLVGGDIGDGGANFSQPKGQVTARAVSEAEGMGGALRDLEGSEDELVKAQQRDPDIQLLVRLKSGLEDSRKEVEEKTLLLLNICQCGTNCRSKISSW